MTKLQLGLVALFSNKVGKSVVVAKRPYEVKHPGNSVRHSRERLTAYTCRKLNGNRSLGAWTEEGARSRFGGSGVDRRFWHDRD